MTEHHRMSDAEVEQTIAALLHGVEHSRNQVYMVQAIGADATAAFRRLCKRLMPEMVRWHAAEINDGPDTPVTFADLGLAMASFAAWMIANYARNSLEPAHVAEHLLDAEKLICGLLIRNAEEIPGAVLDPRGSGRTS